MAIIKHIAIKNSNYDAATDYLTLKHDEFTNKPILDENGNKIPREEFLIEGINCDPFTFGRECEATNALYHKNQTKKEIKAHHYIISFDPRDRDENSLTLESAKDMVMAFAKKNFPGHQTIVCVHPDGHNSAGNIHAHIVINSVRKLNVTESELAAVSFTPERACDSLAGHKHHVTKPFLDYLKQETMSMCQDKSLYQVDLLSPAHVKITDREYWAQRKGQAKLDQENAEQITASTSSEIIQRTVYKTDKEFLRDAIRSTLDSAGTYQKFCNKLFEAYGITVHESRGKIGYILSDKVKPTRGKQLGTDFEKEHILEVLSEKLAHSSDISKKYQSSGIRLVADLEANLKAKQSAAYARKVKIGNLQHMSKTISFLAENNINSLEELNKLLAVTKADATEKHAMLKSTESELKKTNLLIKYTGQYLANKDTYRRYLSSNDKKHFREENHAAITLFEASRKYLKDECVAAFPKLKDLKSQKQELQSRKNQQYEEYSYSRAKYRELQTVAQNVSAMLKSNQEPEHADTLDH